mmetsp:Transcript_33447/g.69641  ORF Transcript_33447/g.69641 Transcript_33447/m.69641 type:complete len:97 (+) Transcript_33447:127-417(+)
MFNPEIKKQGGDSIHAMEEKEVPESLHPSTYPLGEQAENEKSFVVQQKCFGKMYQDMNHVLLSSRRRGRVVSGKRHCGDVAVKQRGFVPPNFPRTR